MDNSRNSSNGSKSPSRRVKFAQTEGGDQAVDGLSHRTTTTPKGALEQLDPRLVMVVERHVFAGMSLVDTAPALDISPATVSRDWGLARAFLNRTLGADRSDG
jgi:DNA-directed RNA polymerase specialized sigma24 family protein